jgi:hypothetical protein
MTFKRKLAHSWMQKQDKTTQAGFMGPISDTN